MQARHFRTMENLKGVIEYIRSFFTGPLESPRKRRAPDSFDCFTKAKYIKLSPSMAGRPRDDWTLNRNSRHLLSGATSKSPRLVETIVLDDEDDFERRPTNISKYTSTPAVTRHKSSHLTNGIDDDDVQYVGEEKSTNDKKKAARRSGLNFLGTFSTNFNPPRPIKSATSVHQNGAIPKTNRNGSSLTNIHSRSSISNNNSRSSAREYSYRLDDKMQYKKLLENVGNLTPDSSGSIYQTPVGKLFNDSRSRSAKILSLGQRSTERSSSKKLSAKDKIIKVLDDFDTDPVVVRDSESDSDVIICPPSPKPDIKVDPVNSLKVVVDTSQHSKKDWLTEIVERHRQNIAQREKEIQEFKQNSDSYGSINRDIQRLHLSKKISESLSLKEAVLPVIEIEEEVEFPELTDEHLRLVKRSFLGDPNEVLVKKFNLNITRRDISTLSGLNWLNDEVINFYMNLIMERSKNNSNLLKTYCFNTFFYPKIIKDGPSAVRRWTKRIDLFSYDLICAPIHLGMHWCMSVINLKNKTIQYYDSMGGSNRKCLEALRNYLEVEHLDKKGKEFDTSGFELEIMKDIPQQMNGSDCGMFSCTFAEFLSRNARITFTQEDMPYLRKKMVVEIVTGELMIK